MEHVRIISKNAERTNVWLSVLSEGTVKLKHSYENCAEGEFFLWFFFRFFSLL